MSVKSMMSFGYPVPLHFDLCEETSDPTGFTNNEKLAVKNVWRVMKTLFYQHALEIHLDFFTTNETLLENYRGKDNKFRLEILSTHFRHSFGLYEVLIERGLDNPQLMNTIMTEMMIAHKKANIPQAHMFMLATAMKDYVLNQVYRIVTPTLLNALEKLCGLIDRYYESANTDYFFEFDF